MKHYDEAATCEKCGGDKIRDLFKAKGESQFGSRAERHGSSYSKRDSIERTCERCHFQWEELPIATPPLAPCEPSAEPSVDRCVAEFARVWSSHEKRSAVDMDTAHRESIAAVMALCLRAREAPSAEFVKAADALRAVCFQAHQMPEVQEFDRARALFVKEKLT